MAFPRQARTAASAVAIGALVLGGSAASCRQVVGIPDPDPPLRCAAPSFAQPSCGECVGDACCVELDACRGDAACIAVLDCVVACENDACREQCEATTKLAGPAAALFACQAGKCSAACGLACGGAGAPVTGCKPCANVCCADGTSFRGSVDGQLLRGCRSSCAPSDVGCREACANVHSEGAHLERAANECVVRACNVPADWSCVGKIDRRRASSSKITISVYALDVETLQPLANVNIKGCSKNDITCATPPFGSTKTNVMGDANLSIQLSEFAGLGGYAGFVEVNREDYTPVLLWFDPPLTTDDAFAVLMSTRALDARLGVASGVPIAADRGAVAPIAVDCHDREAAGVSFHADTADPLTRTAYSRDGTTGGPTFDFTAMATVGRGDGLIVNVPAGPVKVTAQVEDLCLTIATTTLVVRAGATSAMRLSPLPSP